MFKPDYHPIVLKNALNIDSICSIHYFEYMKDFCFSGEKHDFWEFLCVDKGEVEVLAGKTSYTLKKGDIIFHKPNEFHSVCANGLIAPNLVVISFICHSPLMDFFQNQILKITDSDRSLMARIIQEARTVFSTPLNDPYFFRIERSKEATAVNEQLILLYLTELLLSIYRRYHENMPTEPPTKLTKKKHDDLIHERVIAYMEQHVHEHLSIERICSDNIIGRSQLQALFRERNKCGIMEFFFHLKIREAKQKIREGDMNFSQLSDHLGYSSIHYFSRQFKRVTGMTPSEYASSIKAVIERS